MPYIPPDPKHVYRGSKDDPVVWEPAINMPTVGNLLIYIGDQEPLGYTFVKQQNGLGCWYRLATGYDFIPLATPYAFFREYSDVVNG